MSLLKVYYDLMSQPSRALIIFLKQTKIPFTDCYVSLTKGKHLTADFEAINPFKKVPAIEHKGFKLAESVAIVRYLSSQFPIDDHWYPKNIQERAKVDEYLEWQHLNLRLGGAMYFMTKVVYPMLTGNPVNEKSLRNYGSKLEDSIEQLENIFLKKHPFIAGTEISVADIFAACELEQPKAIGFDIYNEHPTLKKWMLQVQNILQPHYDEAHKYIFTVQDRIKLKGKL